MVRLSLRARADLADIAEWISDRSEAAAIAVVEDLARAVAGLEPSPERFALLEGFESQGLRPRLLSLPVGWLRRAFGLAARCGLVRETGFGSAVFERMNQDLVFDAAEGLDVLDYRPRRFEPPRVEPKRRRPAS